MNFDLNAVTLTEFGVGLDDHGSNPFVGIPIDRDVQKALQDMAEKTYRTMKTISKTPVRYEPSEKYSTLEYLYLSLTDNMAAEIKLLHEATNLDIDIDIGALSNPNSIFCYFTKFKDKSERYLTAFKRATQFKGIIKSRLIRIFNDSLKFVTDATFKLDNDFDFLIDAENIYILRPSSFEFAGKLKANILGAVPKNIERIKNELTFVDFDGISEYVGNHPRAARYLASILMQEEITGINKDSLQKLCEKTEVKVSEANGKLIISRGSEMGFLEVLDRRRYELELISGKPEKFKAGSRKQL
jgi:hypothetical protein